MRLMACGVCRNAYQVGGGDLEEVNNLLKDTDNFPCITSGCTGRLRAMKASSKLPGFKLTEVPLRSFYRAINGFGLAKGDPASAKRFVELLKTKKIVDVNVQPVGQPERVIVKQIILEDGTRLHFEASARGACCYFIEEVSPSCLEVLENNELRDHNATEGDSSGTAESREEDGRAPAPAESKGRGTGSLQPTAAADESTDSEPLPIVPTEGDVPTAHHSGERARPEQSRDGDHPNVRMSAAR